MLYKLVYYFLKIFFKICFGVRIFGDIEKFQQIYNNSAAKKIIVANHTSFLDGLLVGLFLPNSKNQQKPLFVVHTWVANAWYFKPILSLVDFLPIEPSNPMAMKTIIKSIENQNRPVVIFPEGRISNTGALMKMYDGPAFIAAKSKAQILPIFISGGVLSKYSRFNPQNEIVKSQKRWFPKITLTFLPPQQINLIENQNLQNATKIYSAREKRRIYSNQLLRIMQESQFLATMQQHQNMTLYEVLCETAELNGKNLPIIEDIKCNENPYS
ncbi:MAG: 1-acyl-sn-glycerol-3-phosphate acyltransferase, partial [Rhodocyclaceae bacterium]